MGPHFIELGSGVRGRRKENSISLMVVESGRAGAQMARPGSKSGALEPCLRVRHIPPLCRRGASHPHGAPRGVGAWGQEERAHRGQHEQSAVLAPGAGPPSLGFLVTSLCSCPRSVSRRDVSVCISGAWGAESGIEISVGEVYPRALFRLRAIGKKKKE